MDVIFTFLEVMNQEGEKAVSKGFARISGWFFKKETIDSLSKTPFTQLANFTGQPAMTVPLYWTSGGLPCDSQFIGRFGDEATLYRLAAQLEKEQPWFDRRPPVTAD